jgi:cytochrome c-type biogenesis protein CcmH
MVSTNPIHRAWRLDPMQTSHAAILALATFALGLVAGELDLVSTTAAPQATVSASKAPVALPAGHPAVGAPDGLADAVRNTVRVTNAPPTLPVATGGAADALVAQAESLRRQRKFTAAAEAYQKLIARNAMTADTWADYADALASASSSLRGQPAAALDRALALDARHPKALWLKASLEHEEQHYADAVKTWQALLAVVPADSSDAKIIRANIDEAGRLARGSS